MRARTGIGSAGADPARWSMRRQRAAILRSTIQVVLIALVGVAARGGAIPWGAMYAPNEAIESTGMTGVVKAYRGERGAETLLIDLAFARDHGVRLIITLGSVAPLTYIDSDGHLDLDAVREELQPFFAIAAVVSPFIEDGTIWGIRFIDEPHDPAGLPRGSEVDPQELGGAFALILERFGDVRVGSTAPPAYMARVPGAGFASGQVVHAKIPLAYGSVIDFHEDQSALAESSGLDYVASINANTNAIDNETFFRDYRRMCEIEAVDFATSWMWPQGHHPEDSFETRFADPSHSVRQEIAGIPDACERLNRDPES